MLNISAMDLQKKVMIILVLIILILGAYWQVQDYEFVIYDDPDYVTENYAIQSGITWQSIADTFTDLRTSNWHPLTMMSHLLDWQMYRGKAGGHHWTSVIIHIFNTILLFLLLNKLTGAVWRSALVAALFAVHPINVESVAWIAERKNVLSTFFWLATMLFYVRYVKAPDWKSYLPVLICFALGLMSKPMLVTLPFVLLLMDYWPLNRTVINTQDETDTGMKAQWSIKKAKLSSLIAEKIPLFVLAAISSGVTVYAARKAGTVAPIVFIPMMQRIDNALLSYVLYLKKLFWPMDLAVFYPHTDIHMRQLLPAVLLLVLITGVVCKYYKKYPYLVVGWFWYLGTLVPVIGIVQVGMQSMADRYAYVPFIGVFMALSWSVNDILTKSIAKKMAVAVWVTVLAALVFMTYHQNKYWENSYTLFDHAIKTTRMHFVPYKNLGIYLVGENKYEEAIYYLNKAVAMNENDPALHNSLGVSWLMLGRYIEAERHFQISLRIDLEQANVHNNLGMVLVHQMKIDEALQHFQKAIQLEPQFANAHYQAAIILKQKGLITAADYHFREAARINPEFEKKRKLLPTE